MKSADVKRVKPNRTLRRMDDFMVKTSNKYERWQGCHNCPHGNDHSMNSCTTNNCVDNHLLVLVLQYEPNGESNSFLRGIYYVS